ncbi:hypothetical protein K505DRAFT_337159 [Melanomma pulvis-pyrius CBS 109.77]|uniref:Uncharacterized protein n=1 Tax=Melanomma pulvis-pyrius CBS 109.77 TaxID=1314802 RepID=A0A6A6XC56_9PLEO|nr:hypothetical protein K505DRAFT_337159 [Melanomma pulvis-pyrius CBS 109.77]
MNESSRNRGDRTEHLRNISQRNLERKPTPQQHGRTYGFKGQSPRVGQATQHGTKPPKDFSMQNSQRNSRPYQFGDSSRRFRGPSHYKNSFFRRQNPPDTYRSGDKRFERPDLFEPGQVVHVDAMFEQYTDPDPLRDTVSGQYTQNHGLFDTGATGPVHAKSRFGIILAVHANWVTVLPLYTFGGRGLQARDRNLWSEYMNVRPERDSEAGYQKQSLDFPDAFTLVVIDNARYRPKETAVLCLSNPVKCHFDSRMCRLAKLDDDSMSKLRTAFSCYFQYVSLPPSSRTQCPRPHLWLKDSAPAASKLPIRTIPPGASSLQVALGSESAPDPSSTTIPTENYGTTPSKSSCTTTLAEISGKISGVTGNAEDDPVDKDQRKSEESRKQNKRLACELESREGERQWPDEAPSAISDSEEPQEPQMKKRKPEHGS